LALLDQRADAAPAGISNEVDSKIDWERCVAFRRTFVERKDNEHRTPDNQFSRDQSPCSAVQTVVSIVPHHEILPGRYDAGLLDADFERA
jgi:hypothetical protein